jgi:uroporphyrinogen-III decarboxylase
MNASQRLYTAMSAGIPDRVPVVPKIWVDLAAALTGIELLDVVGDPMVGLRAILDAALAVDADGARLFNLPERRTLVEDGTVFEVDAQGRRLGRVDMLGGLSTRLIDPADYHLEDPYTMAHHHFWSSAEPIVRSMADVARITVPDRQSYRQFGWEKRQSEILRLAGDKIAIIGDCSSPTLAFHECLRGMDNAMFDLIDEPALVHGLMDKGLAIAIEKGKFHIDMGIRFLRLNDSIANMSVISPQHWREYIKPRFKIFCDELHGYDPAVRIYCHICGNVLPVLTDLVETGLDCIGPLDPLGGFSCREARERVGDAIALMGGVNTMSFIESSVDQIADEARACIAGAGAQGAFILGSGCVVPRSASRANLLAVSEAARQFGRYADGQLRLP